MSIDKLSSITGLSKENIDRIWQEVKDNKKQLDECVGPHDFSIRDRQLFTRRFTCTKCGGVITASDKYWYDKGLQHGRAHG
jgi:5-methylcytosine-specific restriction endonuclease McrA